MSIQDGVVLTSLQWSPPALSKNSTKIGLKYTLFAHRTQPNLGIVRLEVDGLTPGTNVTITDVLDVSSLFQKLGGAFPSR